MVDAMTEENIAELKEAFSRFDRDGDGTIPIFDLGSAMRWIGRDLSENEL